MKNILLINGKKEFGHSKGALNQYMNDLAEAELKNIGHSVQVTVVDDGYDIYTAPFKICKMISSYLLHL